jgi:hypothetical protein
VPRAVRGAPAFGAPADSTRLVARSGVRASEDATGTESLFVPSSVPSPDNRQECWGWFSIPLSSVIRAARVLFVATR